MQPGRSQQELAVRFIESAMFKFASMDVLMTLHLDCLGSGAPKNVSETQLRQTLVDFVDGWRHAENE